MVAILLFTDTIECTNDFNLLEGQIILFYFYVGLPKVATGNNIRVSFVYAMKMAESFILSGIWSVKTGHAKNLAILLPWCLTFPPLLEAGLWSSPFQGEGSEHKDSSPHGKRGSTSRIHSPKMRPKEP